MDINNIKRHLEIHGELTKDKQLELNIDTSTIEMIIQTCQAEWDYSPKDYRVLEKSNEDPSIKCYLCDNRNIKKLHFVVNNKTKVKWIIGDNCADEFGGKIKKSAKEQEDLYKKTLAVQTINETYPGLHSYLERENRDFNKDEMLLPLSIHEKKLDRISKLNELVNKYYKNQSTILLQEIEVIWTENIELEKLVQQYLDENRNNILFPTPEIVRWLKNNQIEVTDIRRNNGLIPKSLFYRISEPNYIRKLIQEIKLHFITIINRKQMTQKILFKIQTITNNDTILEIDTPIFLSTFTELLWNEPYQEHLIKEELLSESSISLEYNSNLSIFKSYRSIFTELGYEIIVNKFDKNDLVLKISGKYIKYNNSKFIQGIRDIHLGLKPEDKLLIQSTLSKSVIKEYDEKSWGTYLEISKNSNSLSRNKREKN